MATPRHAHNTIDPAELLTRDQLAKYFKCSVCTITRLTKQGMLTYFIGARQTPGKYNLDTCKQWMEARTRAFCTPAASFYPIE